MQASIDPRALSCIVDGRPWDSDVHEPLAVVNPANGERVRTVPEAGEEGVAVAVESAAEAFEDWRRATPKERAELLFQLADAIEGRADDSPCSRRRTSASRSPQRGPRSSAPPTSTASTRASAAR